MITKFHKELFNQSKQFNENSNRLLGWLWKMKEVLDCGEMKNNDKEGKNEIFLK